MKNFCGKWKFSAGKQRQKRLSTGAPSCGHQPQKAFNPHSPATRKTTESHRRDLVIRIMQRAGQQLRQFGPTAYGREDSVDLKKKVVLSDQWWVLRDSCKWQWLNSILICSLLALISPKPWITSTGQVRKKKQEPYGKCNCVGKETSMTDSRNVYQVTNWRTSDGGICMAPTAVVSLKYVAG